MGDDTIMHVLHHSAAILNAQFRQTIYDGWHARTAIELSRRTRFKNEAWAHDPILRNSLSASRDGVIFRAFPTSFSLRFRIEYSKSLVDHLEKQAEKNCSLIHLHGDRSLLAYEIIRRFGGKIPTVVQHHGSCGSLFPCNCIERGLFPIVSHFFVLTREKRKYLLSCGVDRDRISVITPGIDTSIFKPISREKARNMLGLPREQELLLYVGRACTRGLDKVIKAVSSLRFSRDINLVAVGAEPTEALSESDRKVPIKLVPRVSHEMMPLYYNAANLLVWFVNDNVLKYGGVGVSVIEALSCNTPVVSNTLLNLPRDLRGNAGELPFSEEDLRPCIVKVLENEKGYNGGRTIAERYFDWAVVARRMSQIYELLLAG